MTHLAAAVGSLLLLAPPTSTPPAPDGWTVLFDGRGTDAWRGYNLDAFPAKAWVVEDGALKTVTGVKEHPDLISREKYRDFELELEWKVAPGGNSGVFYRAAELPPPAPVWHSAPEMQVLDDAVHRDGKEPKTSASSLYALIAPTGKTLKPVGQWNQVRVKVQGQRVEHWLNGQKVVEYDLDSDALKALIAGSKFKDMPRFAREPEGHIALQHHGEEAWFRNIKISTK
jgi:hypothetical protein